MDLEDLQREIDKVMHGQNNRSIPEFEGYSPFEMHQILHFTLEPTSPVTIQKVTETDYKEIPMLNQIKYFLELIRKSGEIKLTAKGFLPTKIVKDIYDQEFLEEIIYLSRSTNAYKESDSMTVNLTRILAEISGLVKKRNGKLSLTKKGEKMYNDSAGLFDLIFRAMTGKFNWAYYDGYGDNNIGQLGYGFSLILLHKYGETKRPDKFYAEKYFKAFPDLADYDSPAYLRTPERRANDCYSMRIFDRFMAYFGLIEIETVGERWDPDKFITKSALFDKLFKVLPTSSHNTPSTKKEKSNSRVIKKRDMKKSNMAKSIYQVKISLVESNPSIWRRLLVPSDMLLCDFHKVIQTAMGWTNSHLHQFIQDNTFYTVRMPGDNFWDEMDNVDYKGMMISDLLTIEKDAVMYEYDFGDGWVHNISLEKISQSEANSKYPVCLDGAMNCPPEDCGGIWGYAQMLEVLENPDDGEYKSYIEWLGGEFDPENFDAGEVNKLLARKDYGCFEF